MTIRECRSSVTHYDKTRQKWQQPDIQDKGLWLAWVIVSPCDWFVILMSPWCSGPSAETWKKTKNPQKCNCPLQIRQAKQTNIQYDTQSNVLSNVAGQSCRVIVAWALSHWKWAIHFYPDNLDRSWALCLIWLPFDGNIPQKVARVSSL